MTARTNHMPHHQWIQTIIILSTVKNQVCCFASIIWYVCNLQNDEQVDKYQPYILVLPWWYTFADCVWSLASPACGKINIEQIIPQPSLSCHKFNFFLMSNEWYILKLQSPFSIWDWEMNSSHFLPKIRLEFISQSQIKGDYNFGTYVFLSYQKPKWHMFSKVTTGRIMCMSCQLET